MAWSGVAKPPSISRTKQAALPGLLLAWYDRHRRLLPWRAQPGEAADPYRVWLSEIMLQQTTVVAVAPYFVAFLRRWPDVNALAAASLDEVLHAWQGLGYYARARNLHACARAVVSNFAGRFPDSEAGLRDLPGIGAYTAAAIAAIAFGRRASALDGNGERVMARIFAVRTTLSAAKPRLRELAAALVPAERPGDYAQALMDLGATLCTPRQPKCVLCPWRGACLARRLGIQDSLPARAAKPEKPRRYGIAFWLVDKQGAIWLRRRPEKGLLGGMMEVPSTAWRAKPWGEAESLRAAPLKLGWRRLPGSVRHSFTHFELELIILAATACANAKLGGVWVAPENFKDQALPNLMKKVIAWARSDAPGSGRAAVPRSAKTAWR
jgi:A/G-specific adenine glycosylase